MNSIRDQIQQAIELKKEEKFEVALKILNDLYITNPTSFDVKKALIEVLFEYGAYLNDEWNEEYDKAVDCFNKIIEMEPDNYKAWYNLGIAHFHLKKTEEALKAYQRALEIKPNYEYVLYNIGLLYETQKGDLKKALSYYEKACKLNEKFTYAFQALNDVRKKLDSLELIASNENQLDSNSENVCANCGNINRAGAKFCDECGEPTNFEE